MIHHLALGIYLIAFALWVGVLLRGSRGRAVFFASATGAVAVGVHAAALLGFHREYGELPLVGPGAALSSLAFVGGLALLVTLPLREAARVAIVLLPFIIVLMGVALGVGIEPSPLILEFRGTGFVLHVAFAFLGYQGFTLAAAAGLLYLVQHHEIKSKRLGRFFHYIPPLATLDKLGRVGGLVGFASLSLALGFGAAWVLQHPGVIALTDPKVVWAIGSWMVFLLSLAARVGRDGSGYRGAAATLVGFLLVVVGYVVLRLTSGATDGLFL